MNAIRVFPLVWLAALCIGATAAANERDQALVLGDSVAFAYIASAGFAYINSDNFVGFANRLDNMVLDAVDAGCPGETTGSFLSATAPDNGCRAFRARFPLHVAYRWGRMMDSFSRRPAHRSRTRRRVSRPASPRCSPPWNATCRPSSAICAPPDFTAPSSSPIIIPSTIRMLRQPA